jgi:hypothetical protein
MKRGVETMPTETEKQERRQQRLRERANRKVEKAIDAMIDIQDMGLGNDTVQRILDSLNGLDFQGR